MDKLLARSLFTDKGRFDLKTGACYAYLESPTSTLRGGRIAIRSHLVARVGIEVNGSCVGASFSSWSVVSGRPLANGGTVRLQEMRVDDVDDPNIRSLIELGLVPVFPNALDLDVLEAVRRMFHGENEAITATVDRFQIDSVTAEDDRLAVRFDFRLVGR